MAIQPYSPCFIPQVPLEPGAVYQVRVVGATSILGDHQETPFRWSFETLDPIPPTVIRTEPAREATGVSPYADVVVFPSASLRTSFDKAIKAGGQAAAFTVMGPDEKPVAGHLSWLTGDEDFSANLGRNTEGRYQGYRGLRFRSLAPLAPGVTYQAIVEGVENVTGVPMEEPYSWSFTTDHGAVIQSPLPPHVRKYYFLGGQRVAQRQIDEFGADVLYWLAGDHLGTTSLVLCGTPGGCDGVAEGEVVAESRHYPYGEERWGSGTLPTDYKFTGQRDTGLGLYHMGARFYDSYLNRWLSADTIVPSFVNPQSLNRYSYAFNNPLRLVDPSGHTPVCIQDPSGPICEEPPPPPPPPPVRLPSKLNVDSLEDLQAESEAMLLTRLVYGEGGGRKTAYSVIVRAESNYGKRGMSIHDQALSPGAYSVFNRVTGVDISKATPEEIANMEKTLNPTNVKYFKDLYGKIEPIVDAVDRGDYRVLPMDFQGPSANNSFRGVIDEVTGQRRNEYYHSPYGTWPWPRLEKIAQERLQIWLPY